MATTSFQAAPVVDVNLLLRPYHQVVRCTPESAVLRAAADVAVVVAWRATRRGRRLWWPPQWTCFPLPLPRHHGSQGVSADH